MDWIFARSEFPTIERYIWLNHAGVSPLPTSTSEAAKAILDDFNKDPFHFYTANKNLLNDTRKIIGKFINCDPDDVAFIKNTTEGIDIIAYGVNWLSGDNVVVPSVEYQTNIYPWLSLEQKGVEVRFVKPVEGRILPEDIISATDERTRVISLSWVEFGNGYRNNLEVIGDFCRQKGILFLVDAVQGLGALRMDVRKYKIDALTAGGHKWLMSPQGVGIFICTKQTVQKLLPVNIGWKSIYDSFNHDKYDYNLLPNAQRYEGGTMNLSGIAGLRASIELLMSVGEKIIEDKVLSLTEYLVYELTRRGCKVISPREAGEKSGIITFISETYSGEELYQLLCKNRVQAALRFGAVRFSPHFYINDEDIERVMNILPI